MNKLRSQIRKALLEIEFPDQYYTQEDEYEFQNSPQAQAPAMIDTQSLKAFLDQEGIFGMESELISILEAQPTPEVQSDLESALKFKQSDKDINTLSVEEMLDIYLGLNNLQQYANKIKSFASPDYHS